MALPWLSAWRWQAGWSVWAGWSVEGGCPELRESPEKEALGVHQQWPSSHSAIRDRHLRAPLREGPEPPAGRGRAGGADAEVPSWREALSHLLKGCHPC